VGGDNIGNHSKSHIFILNRFWNDICVSTVYMRLKRGATATANKDRRGWLLTGKRHDPQAYVCTKYNTREENLCVVKSKIVKNRKN